MHFHSASGSYSIHCTLTTIAGRILILVVDSRPMTGYWKGIQLSRSFGLSFCSITLSTSAQLLSIRNIQSYSNVEAVQMKQQV